jgi:hypothetical protein
MWYACQRVADVLSVSSVRRGRLGLYMRHSLSPLKLCSRLRWTASPRESRHDVPVVSGRQHAATSLRGCSLIQWRSPAPPEFRGILWLDQLPLVEHPRKPTGGFEAVHEACRNTVTRAMKGRSIDTGKGQCCDPEMLIRPRPAFGVSVDPSGRRKVSATPGTMAAS